MTHEFSRGGNTSLFDMERARARTPDEARTWLDEEDARVEAAMLDEFEILYVSLLAGDDKPTGDQARDLALLQLYLRVDEIIGKLRVATAHTDELSKPQPTLDATAREYATRYLGLLPDATDTLIKATHMQREGCIDIMLDTLMANEFSD